MEPNNKRRSGRPKDEALVQRRCEEILEIAAKVFAHYGYRNTDVQMIADKLQVGKGTIYRYFPSKRELFLAATDYGMRRFHEQLEREAQVVTDPLAKCAQAVHSHLAFFDANPQFVELLIQERAEFKDRKRSTYFEHCDVDIKPWQELLQKMIAQGRVRNVPVERLTNVISDLLYGVIFTPHFAERRESLEVQAKNILDVVFFGMLSEQERLSRKISVEESSGSSC